jgi:hypothetical protein
MAQVSIQRDTVGGDKRLFWQRVRETFTAVGEIR